MAITTVQQVVMMMVMMIDDQLHDDDDDDYYHNYQANNLCDLGIERDTLLELCKNFKQIPQVVFLLIGDFGKTPNWRLAKPSQGSI